MYMNQSMESFENWCDSQYDRPEPDIDTPDEQIVRSYTFDYPNDTALTYTRTGNSSELMLSFSSEDPDAGVEELMYAGEQGESMLELVSDLQAELTSWLDAADTSSFAEQQGMSTPDVSLIYGDYTRTALYAFESILKDAEHDLNNQMTWKPIEAEKTDWLYSSHEETDAERGCVGYLRGDFGRSGTEFWTSWFDHSPKLNNEKFRQELQTIVDGLRNEGGLLSNFASMRKGCSYDGAIGNGHYGYRAETSQYEYCLRCIPQRGDYNFYLYCYDKEAQRAHKREQTTTLSTPAPTIKTKTQEMER